jgi:phosphoribosylanthranilate isomerase
LFALIVVSTRRLETSRNGVVSRIEQEWRVHRVRVKICCIASVDEARLAIAHGADALGLIGPMPSGPGPIADDAIAEIAAMVPPPVATFLLTAEIAPEAIVAHARRCRTNTLQLVERIETAHYAGLRDALPATKLVQVIHVTGPEALDEACRVAPHVDAVLLDSGRPHDPVRVLGGTGQVHDWRISRQIVDALDRPVFLAGGLRADNAARAIDGVRPFGLDVCTGVRTDWRLDAPKLGAFMAAARDAWVPADAG